MQRKSLLLVFIISCICLLPLDVGAQIGAVGKILKGTAKAAKSHSYGFSRAAIAAREFERHNQLNRNQDSTYMDSSIKWDLNRFSNQQRLRNYASYAEFSNEDYFVAEDTGSKNDSDIQAFETDSSKSTVDTKENFSNSNVTTNYYSDESNSFAWKLSLGLIIFIVAIAYCCLKLFSKKGKIK